MTLDSKKIDEQRYAATAAHRVWQEILRQRGLGWTFDHDTGHEPPEWVELLAIQLGHLSQVNLAAPADLSGREEWFLAMRQQAVQVAAVAQAFIAQLELRLDGLKEQGKETGRG